MDSSHEYFDLLCAMVGANQASEEEERLLTEHGAEVLRQVLLALALRDESIGGADAAMLADRALELAQADRALDPPAALEAAKSEGSS